MRDESVTFENVASLVTAIVLPDDCIDYVGERGETTPGEKVSRYLTDINWTKT